MPGFRLSTKAQADLRDIGRYTQRTWGREQRNRYLAKLDDAFHLLAGDPERGRPCDAIRPGYRHYAVGRHRLFYRLTLDTVDIIRILHERMDIEARLMEC